MASHRRAGIMAGTAKPQGQLKSPSHTAQELGEGVGQAGPKFQPDPATQEPPPASVSTLKAAEEKHKQLHAQLRDVERQIYDLETRYLAGCNPNANALKGFEGLHSLVGSSKPATAPPAPEDRIFSSSSINFTPSA